MRRLERNYIFLFLGITGISALAFLTNTYEPNQSLLIAIFFALIAEISLTLSFFILKNIRYSVLITIGAVTFLLLRYFKLNEPIYFALLAAVLISLELYLRKG